MDSDALIEGMLEQAVETAGAPGAPPLLMKAIRHALFPGGARVRPKLCLAIAGASGDAAALAPAAAAGAALEILHCASLVHDDLPAFDDAAMRRGKPSVHVAFSEPLAILAGDAMIVMAFEAVLNGPAIEPAMQVALLRILSGAIAPPGGIIAGQAWESERDVSLTRYHQAKTGALFVAASMCGAVAAGHDPERWRGLGAKLGEAYQVADDLRDVLFGDETLGKPAGQDAANGRPNAAMDLGLKGAAARLEALIAEAVDSIPPCAGRDRLAGIVAAQAARLMPKSALRRVA